MPLKHLALLLALSLAPLAHIPATLFDYDLSDASRTRAEQPLLDWNRTSHPPASPFTDVPEEERPSDERERKRDERGTSRADIMSFIGDGSSSSLLRNQI